MLAKNVTTWIVVCLVLGLAAGYFCFTAYPQHAARFAEIASIPSTVFLRLIKMIIAPLVFSTLVVGIGKMGDIASVGRVGAKALLWFMFASIISLSLGLILVGWLEPGKAMSLTPPAVDTASGVSSQGLSLQSFITHTIPTSIIDAMARNEILQIVIFSLFFGIAIAALGTKAADLIALLDTVSHVMLKVTGYVMLFAPAAVFGAIASVVAKEGPGVLGVYGIFLGEFYLGIALLWVILISLGVLVIGPRALALMRRMREPTILAFATASSESAYPRTLEELERFGISNRTASFVLPVGYSFNLDGSMMYCTFAVMFIAQVYGIEMSAGQQIIMVGVLLLTSKGMAGVPRAALVVVAATLSQFNIPDAGLLLLLGIDHFLDMGRSATNVIGNSIATAVVSKWEGELSSERPSMRSNGKLAQLFSRRRTI